MIDLTVKTLDSQNHSFSLDDDITVRGFKEYIAESVAVPADSQRLIYCGRVLQDEKKLNDYDVNGKVIHLVQRAPPQPGQRGNGGTQSQNTGGTHRTHYRFNRDPQNSNAGPNAQVHGNAMYLGAMTLPTEVVEEHGLPVPQLSNTLSISRIVMAKRMLYNANRILDRLDNPNIVESENSATESQQMSSPSETADFNMDTSRPESSQVDSMARLPRWRFTPQDEASNFETLRMNIICGRAVSEILRLLNIISSAAEDDTDIHEVEVSTSNDTQPETLPQQQPRASSSNDEPSNSQRSRATSTLPRPPLMAEVLELLMNTQDRLRPYLERYRILMSTDPALSATGTGPESVTENQLLVDEVSRILHYVAHANHALSDIIVDMGQEPPRNLRCRPIIIQQSAILQAGIPIQLEAHISLQGRNSQNNNNTNEENNSTSTAPTPPDTDGGDPREILTDERLQQQNSANQQQNSDSQQRPDQQQQQSQTAIRNLLSSMFNLPNNVGVLMEVSPDSSMDINSLDDQSPNNGANNNSNGSGNAGRGPIPWHATPPTDFIRNLMHAVAGHIVQDPSGMTSNHSGNAATVTISQQTIGVTIDSNGQNSGQSTQARNNVGTHPTTSTQTRSTSRPHVFHSHGVGLGSSTDPFLPCNSHHLRRSTSSSNTSRRSATSRNQTEPQSAASSNTANSTTTTSSTTFEIDGDRYLERLRLCLGNRRFRQYRKGFASSLKNLVRTLSNENFDVRYSGAVESPRASSITLADLLENTEEGVESLSTHVFDQEGNILTDLSILLVKHVTIEGFVGLIYGEYGAVSSLRRPLRVYLQALSLSQSTPPTALPDLVVEKMLSCLRKYLAKFLPSQKHSYYSSIDAVDIVGSIEALLRRHFLDLFKRIFDEDLEDATFEQEAISVLGNLGIQVSNVLRYLIVEGRLGAVNLIQRLMLAVAEDLHPLLRRWIKDIILTRGPDYITRVVEQLSNAEILPLLVYETKVKSSVSESSESSESSKTETVDKDFCGSEILLPLWVPVIAQDGVRQRRLSQGISSGGVQTFSDAYLGCLPSKRRKIYQQEKPQILVSPNRNHSTILNASIERLVRESVSRAGVTEVEGAAMAVSNDLGVRSAFGQAIRDCLQPQKYGTPDFPNSSRFPNATKFFHEDRPPKQ